MAKSNVEIALTRGARRSRSGCTVTPKEPMTLGDEVLTPGRDRFHPTHDAVRANPSAFRPVAGLEPATERAALNAIARHLERQIAERGGGRRPGANRGRRWRLP
jgi:hypothetical protein